MLPARPDDHFGLHHAFAICLGHLNALVGNTEYESGMAFLSSYNNQRTKGQKVTAALEIQFDGTPTRIAKA